MVFRIVYQGLVIGIITLVAFILGLSSNSETIENLQGMYPNLSAEQIKVEIGQTMAFIVISFAELMHIFNIRNNKKSIFKTGIGGNKMLFIALAIASALMFVVLFIPGLQNLFGIIAMPKEKIFECVGLIIIPVIIVEIMKAFKINTSKEE